MKRHFQCFGFTPGLFRFVVLGTGQTSQRITEDFKASTLNQPAKEYRRSTRKVNARFRIVAAPGSKASA